MVFAVNEVAQRGDAEAMKCPHFQGQFTIPADLAGTPTLSLPCGFSDRTRLCDAVDGRKFAEAVLCRSATLPVRNRLASPPSDH